MERAAQMHLGGHGSANATHRGVMWYLQVEMGACRRSDELCTSVAAQGDHSHLQHAGVGLPAGLQARAHSCGSLQ